MADSRNPQGPSPTSADCSEPIFIVGAPRSGTTLLAALLASHSRLECGPETHFFDHLARVSTHWLTRSSVWPEPAVAFLTSLRLNGERVHELFELGPDQLRAYLTRRRPSIPAMLEALTVQRAEAAGKPRWVEKTPNHLLHLAEIRRHYPSALIVRIVRDPRDAALSIRKLPWASRSVLANVALWQDWDSASWRFFARDPRTVSVRYEDLITQPEAELHRLCAAIGERFEPGMLQQQAVASRLAAASEWWKRDVGRPIDRTRVRVWEHAFPEADLPAAERLCGEGLDRHGYPRAFPAPAWHPYFQFGPNNSARPKWFLVASKPGFGARNRYNDLFYRALEPAGVAMVSEFDFSPDWLREHTSRIDALHLHWPEKLWRSYRPNWMEALHRRGIKGSWRLLCVSRSWRKALGLLALRRFLRGVQNEGLKLIWTAHNLEPHEDADWLDRVGYRMLATRADLVICHGPSARSAFAARYRPRGRVVAIPHGNYDGGFPAPRDRDVVLRSLGLRDDRPIVACVGELRNYKGIDRACDAVDRLEGAVQLVVAGVPDPAFDLDGLRRRIEGKPWITLWVQALSDQEFADVVSASEAVLLPYRTITGSGAVMAALTLGRGVVASDLPFFRETLAPQPDAGRLVAPPCAPEVLAVAIREYLDVPAAHRRTAARRLADQHAWSEVIRPVTAVFEEWAAKSEESFHAGCRVLSEKTEGRRQ
jgi:beta-1,4-mannosyltransferase